MKKLYFLFIFVFLLVGYKPLFSQDTPLIQNKGAEVFQGDFIKSTVPLRDFIIPPFDGEIVREENLGVNIPSYLKKNEKRDTNALPQGPDPVWQQEYIKPRTQDVIQKALIQSFEGIDYTNINPPDPCMDVGPNHVIQMTNGSGGSYFKIFDKAGNVLQTDTYLDSFTGISGFGDPIVLWDPIADVWLMSEFATTGNVLVVAISQTPDPLGAWYVYSYTTPYFPDYPKFAVNPESFIITTNDYDQGSQTVRPAVYALDRTKLLSGDPGTFQRIEIPPVPGVLFQVSTPVDFDGTMLPPTDTIAYIMRIVDDGWDSSITQDVVDMFEFDIDWVDPSASTLTLVQSLVPSAFDTDFCGYNLPGCIDQQGSNINLWALSQLLMNRVSYRRYPNHESIVATHTVDVDGNNRGGVRWYEFRRPTTTSNWVIHQEGTYAPTSDSNSRWLPTITINDAGHIGLGFNVAGPTAYPSMRYTGRLECDTLGQMTEPETVVADGSAASGSDRYGDYSSLDVDPSDDSFWFTAEYSPASTWSTKIVNFDLETCDSKIAFEFENITAHESDANIVNNCQDYKVVNVRVLLSDSATVDPIIELQLSGTATNGLDYEAPATLIDTFNYPNTTFTFKIFDDGVLESPEQLVVNYILNPNGGNTVADTSNQTLTIDIVDDDLAPSTPVETDVNLSNGAEEYFGPFQTVHFYDPTSGEVMVSLTNNSSHDYGCTTVEIDRSGNNPSALLFNAPYVDEYVASKTFKITPTNVSTSGSYIVELYYKENEIQAWENVTGNNRSTLRVVKVAGNNSITDVTPANASSFNISYNQANLSNYNGDVIVNANISSGFSGFGIGRPESCDNIPTNTWVGPASGDWNASVSNWSLGVFPDYCHHVVIPAGKNVKIISGQIGKGFTLHVNQGGHLETIPGGLLDIVAPE